MTKVMNVNAITENEDMKISCRRSNDTRHSKPLSVMVSKFETDSFPVRVRLAASATTGTPDFPSRVLRFERRFPPLHRNSLR
jgi:hypothetical protein